MDHFAQSFRLYKNERVSGTQPPIPRPKVATPAWRLNGYQFSAFLPHPKGLTATPGEELAMTQWSDCDEVGRTQEQ
jgi:hypothetical protein